MTKHRTIKHKISIIIPTYNEADNIASLIIKIEKAYRDAEIIVVDDNSPDGTAGIVRELQKTNPKIKLKLRLSKRGLSSAVIDGFSVASGSIIGVMDADHSHPPELLPKIIKKMEDYDFILGSRYIKGGGISNWPLSRKLISKFATLLARPLVSIKDPMSGYFMFKRKIIRGVKLEPEGFKIALEILVKAQPKHVKEIPFIFNDRQAGKSKLGMETNFIYLHHLIKLYKYKYCKRK